MLIDALFDVGLELRVVADNMTICCCTSHMNLKVITKNKPVNVNIKKMHRLVVCQVVDKNMICHWFDRFQEHETYPP